MNTDITHTVEHTGGDTRCDAIKIGLLSASDRAASGVYQDQGIPSLKAWIEQALHNPIEWHTSLIADEFELIASHLKSLVSAGCSLVLTTGGAWETKRCQVLENKCDKSVCALCPRPSCRAKWP
jgi:molybdopterin biosynthesis enzyme MoaB